MSQAHPKQMGERVTALERQVQELNNRIEDMGRHLTDALNGQVRLDLVMEVVADLVGRAAVQEAVDRKVFERAEAIEVKHLEQLRSKVEAGELLQVVTVTERSAVFCRMVDPKTGGRRSMLFSAEDPSAASLLGKSAGDQVDNYTILGVYNQKVQ